jgi:serine/threonine-protein kinase
MEFLEGETLSARLARAGKLPSEEALEIARQLCAGLAAAHNNGILHRDLKAANVILNRRQDGSLRAVITDFGLATEVRLGSVLDGGTPTYMAPELWRGEKPGKASDVYALGVILYEIVR